MSGPSGIGTEVLHEDRATTDTERGAAVLAYARAWPASSRRMRSDWAGGPLATSPDLTSCSSDGPSAAGTSVAMDSPPVAAWLIGSWGSAGRSEIWRANTFFQRSLMESSP